MFVLHLALQGCLRGQDVEYGVTADTGGHIRYLLELAAAASRDPRVERLELVTRAFRADFTAGDYARPREYLNPKASIVRLAGASNAYLPKERLAAELAALTDALDAYIAGLDQRPDFIHAHYADAAVLAAEMRARYGIPFVFTGHSLGRSKRACAGRGDESAAARRALDHRIACEERALAEAELVVASSRDEAEMQYAAYRHYAPGRVRVIEPGSDLRGFAGAKPNDGIDAMLGRFLDAPDKPALLAIARPVSRKNLAALVRAYGESPALQARANLVLIAGNREAIDALEPELATNMRQLLALIDRYDLHGRIAYPERHRSADIPAIYAWARERGGVFVNPALNEPFGLTLLEAAAAGLPVVATDSGGPTDIVGRCHNGVLVDARSPQAIADAALGVLDDAPAWQRFADNGRAAMSYYDWRAHAGRYLDLLERLKARTPPGGHWDRMLASDIDGTLTGSAAGIRALNAWLDAHARLCFGVATGRSLHSALAEIERHGIRRPRFVIAGVGSEVYWLADDGVTYTRDDGWDAHIAADWPRDAIGRALAGCAGVRPQPPIEQREHKLSYFADAAAGEAAATALAAQGLDCMAIASHGCYLDVLPARAGKGAALDYVRERLGVGVERCFAAGDSGNDVALLRHCCGAIIVANYRDDLASRPGLEHAYVARAPYAHGVVEGLRRLQERAQHVS